MWLIRSTNQTLIKQVQLMLHEISEIFFKTGHIDVEKSRFWQRIHHSILLKMLSLSHWNVPDNGHKYQLCTSNLTVPTHESNYVYRYVRPANSFSYKAIYALANGHFEHRCIIQYRWKFFPSHIEMCLTRSTNFSYVHLI